MKPIACHIYLLVIALALSGCVSSGAVNTPTLTATQVPSSTPILPTSTNTNTPLPTKTATLTPPATLETEQAKETIRNLLQEPVDCEAPCFWGIKPGKTTLDEAKNIFTRLGLQVKSTACQDKDSCGIRYAFDSGLSIMVILAANNGIVTDSRVDITPETQKAGVQREWQAYSPETLIKRYGLPSKVNFWVGRGPKPSYEMGMYFDTVDLLIVYNSYDFGPNPDIQACPISRQINHIRIFLGHGPEYRDSEWVPLEEATSLTMEGFSKLMTGDPNKACINFNLDVFQ